ncbi:MAG: undecaprenyldiphospho-muramoylpentapeptide beta-N-acetylglucosaminyltransferase [Solirubrobacterales bacterium]
MAPTVVIAAGGTAGHVVPALAVADALRADGARVSFIGARDRLEATLVPEAGYEVDLLDLRGLDRHNPLRAADAVRRAGIAVPRVRRLLRGRGADAVLGGGGYVAAPAGLAALSLRLPLVLTEADRHLGLTNRALARRARRVCLAFPIEGRNGPRYVVTGRPVPAAIGAADREAARRRFGIEEGDRCLLVFGGSQGARSINLAALEAFAAANAPAHDFHVLHISGSRDYGLARETLGGEDAVPGYTLVEYEPGLADALAASDLVLARSGGSIFEIAAARRPAILVPYPHAAGDHQRANAEWMADGGAAVVIDDAELDPARLRATAAELLRDPERLEAMARASALLARPDAAERVAGELLAAISEPESR